MTPLEKPLRTFIAVELSAPLQQAIETLTQGFKNSGADIKWVGPHNCHLTLKFLGPTRLQQIDKIKDALHHLAQKTRPFFISLDGCGVFPSWDEPRVIWLGVTNGSQELTQLAQNIEEGLLRLGFSKEKRAFTSHITIGRVRSEKNLQELKKLLKDVSIEEGKIQEILSLTFFHSVLTSQGAVHQPLGVFSFAKNLTPISNSPA